MATNAARRRLILWDVDHTLIESRGIGGHLARAAFLEVAGIPPEQIAEATGKTEPVILAETLLAHGIEPTEDHQRRYANAPVRASRSRAPRSSSALCALEEGSGIADQ